MKPLPKSSKLLMRLADDCYVLLSDLFARLAYIDKEIADEAASRELCCKMSAAQQIHVLRNSGVLSPRFRDELEKLDLESLPKLVRIAEYLHADELQILSTEGMSSKRDCKDAWMSATSVLPKVQNLDESEMLRAIFDARDLTIEIVRKRVTMFRQLFVYVQRLQTQIADAIEAQSTSSSRFDRGMPKDEANIKVRELLKDHFKQNPDGKMPTMRDIASAVGCSAGLVGSLVSYKAVADRLKSGAKPKAVANSEGALQATGVGKTNQVLNEVIDREESDKELNRLIDEQSRDASNDPTPLEADPPDRKLAARHHKRV